MKLLKSEHCGFCFGVQNAVNLAMRAAKEHPDKKVYTLGKLIHNETVTEKLAALGAAEAQSPLDIENGAVVIIRSHGVGRDVLEQLQQKDAVIIDATCPFVKKIQDKAREYHAKGFQIVILGEKGHPEVIGINGWCGGQAVIINSEAQAEALSAYENVCVVAQTTFSAERYNAIVKIIQKLQHKSVEIFDTICYTTYARQKEAYTIAKECDAVLVLGSQKSSNTLKLFDICKSVCERSYRISQASEIKKIKFKASDKIGIVAGASTPEELITEVVELMSGKFKSEVQNAEFMEALEESPVALREGKRIKGTVIMADEKGVSVNIGHKKDGFIPNDEASLGAYDPEEFVAGAEVEALIVSTKANESGCIMLSKKSVDAAKEGDRQVEIIRNGEPFELVMEKDTKGGLLSKLGNYTVFVPASQVRESFVKDLKQFAGKSLRLTAIEIDDQKRRIVASARKLTEEERKAREEIFWNAVKPDVIVNGKVKRITNFGAFVSVDGFDCLAHITDLSWNRLKSADDVVKIGQSYDFLVLSADRERGRVSLSYRLLQAHPFDVCIEKYPVGSKLKGKVMSILPFGAFVEIEAGVEGLVHVSEAAHNYVKSVSEVVKAGDEVEVMVLSIDPDHKKINLSIKACLPDDGTAEDGARTEDGAQKGKGAKKGSKKKGSEPGAEWVEDASNNPFAELLQDLEVEDKK
ncbi:MAG: bifunctional 4-hydroxy-3-methylbut-2-enyl diphosphate reductase/30S ribosomal protein S1 [Firmicutes bacterium]|nr:bifunctional 4-hydroxy-3-methylbut-2-enyl diphosphate reductase/30S ribosomal protein S1 [Bacillota bacterium]